jgi:hypothetical protein
MAKRSRTRATTTPGATARVLDARRDTLDFRDLMYEPTLVEVPAFRSLDEYRRADVPILDQGSEGACTGFGLATVAHYLLRTHRVGRDATVVSPYMFYDLARRYDEWAGDAYEGSSCRGAMKGWQKHGVCAQPLWPKSQPGAVLDHGRVENAAKRPLGAYFRVNHSSLVAMHAAITESGVLYASSTVHAGWQSAGKDGMIVPSDQVIGGHAFAIVAYDADGFWIQNSWGVTWGKQGFGHVTYDDWLKNGTDVWVARLGVPVRLMAVDGTTRAAFAGTVRAKTWSYADLRPHVVSIGNHGVLDPHGDIGTTPEMVREIVRSDIPRITASWAKKRIVLYAHGGLVKQDDALQRVNEYRDGLLAKECYPLAFIWHSDFWSTVKGILSDATAQRRPEGFLDSAKDFMLDRLDDMLEPLARQLGGRDIWSRMKEKAAGATARADGGARLVADELATLAKLDRSFEIHVAAHSAGAILLAPLLVYLSRLGVPIKTCTLWAPAVTTALFRETYLPLIQSGAIGRFALFQLDDTTEQDDNCAGIYHKSLLYLLSNAFEDQPRIPLIHPQGEPLLGIQKFIDADPSIGAIFADGTADRVIAPTNGLPPGDPNSSEAKHHADFDDDRATVLAALARILGSATAAANATIGFKSGASRKREIRRRIDKMPDFAATR